MMKKKSSDQPCERYSEFIIDANLKSFSIGPDFPSLANEIAEQRPEMNIKVTAFTVAKKLYYTYILRGMEGRKEGLQNTVSTCFS